MAETGGVNIVLTPETATAVAQRLVCWDREGGVRAQSVQYRTDGNRPYFHIPAGACADKAALLLTPDGSAVACPETGATTRVEPTAQDVSGVNPNTCEEIQAPTGLAVTGSPTASAITVHWSAPSGAAPTGYRLSYRPAASSGAWTHQEVAAGSLQATATGLTANTGYAFHVQARHGTYLSPPTPDVTISTAAS